MHPSTLRLCGWTASTVWRKKPRPRSLPICLNEADFVTVRQINVGGILHQQSHWRAVGLFFCLLQMWLDQCCKRHIRLVKQTVQCFCLFPGMHLSWQRAQRILCQVAGCFYRASRSTQIVQLDAPKGLLSPALGSNRSCVFIFDSITLLNVGKNQVF